MPARPRLLNDMFAKYSTKYDGKNVTTVLTALKPIMEARYQSGASVIFDVFDRVKTLLSNKGVSPAEYALYLSFAAKLASHTFSHSGNALAKYAAALKAEWVTGYGADPTIIDAIINEVTGLTAPY